jgi:3'(2'), 5'-bisphosphate nucleotidase
MEDDDRLAHALAADAAERLVSAQDQAIAGGRGGWWLEDHGDSLAHDYLVDELRRARPTDGLLSEEGHDDGDRVGMRRAWIVDPLDGSNGFGSGNAEWAVHVGLAADGEALVGAVAVPGMGITASTHDVPAVPDSMNRRPVVITGRSRIRSDGQFLAEALDADLTACSSAGVKAVLVAIGKADVYVHDAPLYEWDVCAPVAVALAAGLDACGTDGSTIQFNKDTPVVDSLVICRREFTTDVVQALQSRSSLAAQRDEY